MNRRLLISPLIIPRLPFCHPMTSSSPLLVSEVHLSGSCSFCGRRLNYYSYKAQCNSAASLESPTLVNLYIERKPFT